MNKILLVLLTIGVGCAALGIRYLVCSNLPPWVC